MNIALYVHSIDQIGGAELSTQRLARRFAGRGHNVTILTTQPLSQWRKRRHVVEYQASIRIFRLPVWQRSHRVFSRMLKAEARIILPLLLRDADIFQLRGLNADSIALARAARRCGVPSICVPMASGEFGDVARLRSDPLELPFDWISALTEAMRSEVTARGFPATRTSVIPNGVDLAVFRPSALPNLAADAIFVGQFRPEKRVDVLLHAWQAVQRAYPQVKLHLIGGSEHRMQYQQFAEALGIQPHFDFASDEQSVRSWLQASGIFIMSGISEGMSNALLEAMAVGLAPIVSDTPANRAVITPEINGLCYPPESATALAQQITRLMGDYTLRSRLGAAARRTVETRFNLDHVADQYLECYTRLLGKRH